MGTLHDLQSLIILLNFTCKISALEYRKSIIHPKFMFKKSFCCSINYEQQPRGFFLLWLMSAILDFIMIESLLWFRQESSVFMILGYPILYSNQKIYLDVEFKLVCWQIFYHKRLPAKCTFLGQAYFLFEWAGIELLS